GPAHTNTIEGFWSLLRRGISGVYHGVSTQHLQDYVDEYVFRYNNRAATGRGMFEAFLARAVSPLPKAECGPCRGRQRTHRGMGQGFQAPSWSAGCGRLPG